MRPVYTYILIFLSFSFVYGQPPVTGKVLIQENNETYPLAGVNIFWLDSAIGTVSDQDGNFTLKRTESTDRLILKYLGFTTDTLRITSEKNIFHFMQEDSGESLEEVELVQRRKAIQTSYLKAQNVLQVNNAELLKAACCNLSESFETNPSIDVNFSDALTGTKQIRMLGLSSPYLLITEENIPSVRGASQIYGLTFTPGTWIESIQITKGAGSVANGFESIAGQINTELQKPFKDAPFFFNVFHSINGRGEVNVHWNSPLNDRWSTGIYVHANQRKLLTDRNNDLFFDMPLTKQVNFLNRWQYTDTEKGWVSFLSFRFLEDQKQTGATDFSPTLHKGTTQYWGSEIQTKRIDVSVKAGYVFPLITYQSLGFQAAYSSHNQQSYFGLREYNIQHDSFFGNILFNSIIGNTLQTFKTGVNVAADRYDEEVEGFQYRRTDASIGAYFEYTNNRFDRWNIVAGIRLDHHNNLGTFFTPRLHLRYTPWERSALRFSAGQGRKAANIFAENQTLFSTNRAINLQPNGGTVYGFQPERAWNYGMSWQQGFTLWQKQGELTVDFYRTEFQNQVVVDWETQGYVRFYNLEGSSFANSFQLGVDYAPTPATSLRLAYKNYRVKTTYREGLKQNPLQPQQRFFANGAYTNIDESGKGWRADLTYHLVGEQRLPTNARDGANFMAGAYGLWNTQITRVFSSQFEIYLGGENIGNLRQNQPIIGVDQPFGRNFDASLVYAPVFGRMVYAGLRFNLKKQ